MQTPRYPYWRWLLMLLVSALILKVTLSVVLGYRDYFPANFRTAFLLGRESYFWGAYAVAFYAHILTGPITLVLGLLLLSEPFRNRHPRRHRILGRTQGMLVLLVVAPSGLWMARYAERGVAAGAGFAALAIVTGACAAMGWRAAVQRHFAEHRHWMLRCYLLLCSAVVLRLIGGLSLVTGVSGPWSYPMAAWVSWLAPLAAFETLAQWAKTPEMRSLADAHSATASPTGSSAMEMIARKASGDMSSAINLP